MVSRPVPPLLPLSAPLLASNTAPSTGRPELRCRSKLSTTRRDAGDVEGQHDGDGRESLLAKLHLHTMVGKGAEPDVYLCLAFTVTFLLLTRAVVLSLLCFRSRLSVLLGRFPQRRHDRSTGASKTASNRLLQDRTGLVIASEEKTGKKKQRPALLRATQTPWLIPPALQQSEGARRTLSPLPPHLAVSGNAPPSAVG